jgi:hypothetical protein
MYYVSFEEAAMVFDGPMFVAVQRLVDSDDYELRDEYDLSRMTAVAKGRYAPCRRAGKNVILYHKGFGGCQGRGNYG